MSRPERRASTKDAERRARTKDAGRRARTKGEERAKGSTWSLAAAAGAAIAASACCTIPLVLVSLGIGGAWIGSLTALAPYRWIFVALAGGALVYAGYNEWRMVRDPDCACETAFSPVVRRTLLAAGALAVLALIVSPWLIAPSPSAASEQAKAASSRSAASENSEASPLSFQQVVLEVDGMTCSTCPTTVRKALERVDGVYNVEATLEPPQAIVRFDPTQTSISELTEATARAGFPSSPNPSS